MNQPRRHSRKKKFIEPRIQLRFIVAFACTAALAVLVQAVVLVNALSSLAGDAPNDKEFILESIPKLQVMSLVATLGVLLPLALVVGIYMTFPIVGPIYRFRTYLGQLASGEATRPCKIRDGDDLQDLCEILNTAVAPLVERNAAAREIEEREAAEREGEDLQAA